MTVMSSKTALLTMTVLLHHSHNSRGPVREENMLLPVVPRHRQENQQCPPTVQRRLQTAALTELRDSHMRIFSVYISFSTTAG